jgi:prolyl-tRNA editing enzyme YbaK/EbsC (Cys-tRNA(Pro) deacylase)
VASLEWTTASASTASAPKAGIFEAAEVPSATGHPVSGVWPFGLPRPLVVYPDRSLRAISGVLPPKVAARRSVSLEEAACELWGLTNAT